MLAIIIPYYNLTFFDETLESLAIQTDKRFKVYIGDDASPECPDLLLEKYYDKFDFVYNRFKSNLGSISLTKQWERCIALIKDEEWIMILGDDDKLGPKVVELFNKNVTSINSKSINVIRFSSQVIDGNAKTISNIFHHPQYESATDSFFRKLNNYTRSSLSEYVFRKSVYNKYKFADFPLAWYADDMAWIEFAETRGIFSINHELIYFRYSGKNISSKTDNLDLKEKSKYLFYKMLVTRELTQFTEKQQFNLLTTFELLLKKRGIFRVNDFFFLTRKYIANGQYSFIPKFIKRQILYMLNQYSLWSQ